jgi:hypothetical protein
MPAPTEIGHLIDRELTVDLSDETYDLTAIDWPALLREQEELKARVKDLDDDERSRILQGEPDPVSDIYEYFLFGYEDEVESGRWLPFGVVGLSVGNADSFAELNNEGMLVFDLTRADGDAAPVLWVREDEVIEVADELAELPITARDAD